MIVRIVQFGTSNTINVFDDQMEHVCGATGNEQPNKNTSDDPVTEKALFYAIERIAVLEAKLEKYEAAIMEMQMERMKNQPKFTRAK